MRPDSRVLVIGGLLCLLPSTSLAGEVVIEVLSESAVLEVQRARDELAKDLKKQWPVTWNCKYGSKDEYRCVSRNRSGSSACGEWSYLEPFPIAARGFQACEGFLESYGWTTTDKAQRGAEALDEYLAAATQGVSMCTAPTCQVVLRTNEITVNGARASGLMQCDVEVVGETLGAPGNCEIVAFQSGSQWLLRVVRGLTPVRGLMGAPDFDLALYSPRPIDTVRLLNAIKKKLSESPLALAVDPRRGHLPVVGGTDSVIAVTKHRRSNVLPMWEWVTVRVDRYDPRAQGVLDLKGGKRYRAQSELQVSLTLLLNQRNTAEYRMPKDVEFSQYLDIVRASIGLALEESCRESEWLDGRTLICDH